MIAIFATRDAAAEPCFNGNGPVRATRWTLVISLQFGLISPRTSPVTVISDAGSTLGNSGVAQGCGGRKLTSLRRFDVSTLAVFLEILENQLEAR